MIGAKMRLRALGAEGKEYNLVVSKAIARQISMVLVSERFRLLRRMEQ
jgi:hypothetical protein